MTKDRLVGLALLLVAGVLVIVAGLGVWLAAFIVVTGVAAGLVAERVAHRR